MIQADVKQAEADLDTLVARAEAGEEVVIARDGTPVVRLEVIEAKPLTDRRPRSELFGLFKGQMTVPSAEEWAAMDQEIEAEFEAALNKVLPEPPRR